MDRIVCAGTSGEVIGADVMTKFIIAIASWFGLMGSSALASPVFQIGTTITVPASPVGASFTYNGTLTQDDTLGFHQTGRVCLDSGPAYCTNGAGIVEKVGSYASDNGVPIGGTLNFPFVVAFNGTLAAWTFGALVLEIPNAGTVAILPPTVANGFGSNTPPRNLRLPGTSLADLGFANFSLVDPTITFVVSDTFYEDNRGRFVLTNSISEPSPLALLAIGFVTFGLLRRAAPRVCTWRLGIS